MRRAKLSDPGDGVENRTDPRTVYQKGRLGSQAGGVRNSTIPEGHGGEAQGPDGRDQGRSGTEKTVGGTPGNGPATDGRHGMSLVPPKRTLCSGVPDQRNRRKLGKRAEETVMVGNGLYLPGRIEGNGVSFLVDTRYGVSILAARTWRKWGRTEDELTRYWG